MPKYRVSTYATPEGAVHMNNSIHRQYVVEAADELAAALAAQPAPPVGVVEWTDENYNRARDCMIEILRGHAWTINHGSRGTQEFDNAFKHAVGILALTAARSPSTQKMRPELPLQYEDGPDYCTVRDSLGRDFALTMQPELMKAMEAALAAQPVAPVGEPINLADDIAKTVAAKLAEPAFVEFAKRAPKHSEVGLLPIINVGPTAVTHWRVVLMSGREIGLTDEEWKSAAPPPSTQKVVELLKRAQRIIERDYPNGQLAIDIRAALSTNPGEQEWANQ